ncbi:hypothetical protein [Cellulosimicrobium sp. Marseille-Q8652]
MDTGTFVAIATALGAGSILTKLFDNIVAWFQGRQQEERSAWAERDKEAKARRLLEESLQRTRLLAVKHGATDDELGHWPEY